MPSFCVVSNCELKYTHSENVSFHKFPLHEESLLQKWIKFTDRGADWKPSRWSSICSRHFLNSDFRELLSRKCLKKNAVPSLVTKNNISYETYHIPDQSATANSQYGDEDLIDCNDHKGTDSTTDQTEKNREICCRLCGDHIETSARVSIDDAEVCEMLRKCLPSISVLRNNIDHLNLICKHCESHLRGYSDFLDKVLTHQRDLANNAEPSLEDMVFEPHANICSAPSNSALFIKQEPINVKQEILDNSNKKPQETLRPSFVPSISALSIHPSSASDQRHHQQSLIQWPRTCANTFCQLCERFFINNAEMKSHECNRSKAPNADRIETLNVTSNNNNNCEIMEIITLNNPISFIDLAEDECAATAVCKKEIFIDGERRERVDIEHAYAKRSTIPITNTSNTCKLKQEIEMNYDFETNDDIFFDAAANNDNTNIPDSSQIITDVTSAPQDIFVCSKCGQKFNTIHLLIGHANQMHSLKNRICVICSSEFKSTYEYLLHKNKVHASGHRCQQCKRKFNTRLALKNHERHSCLIDSMDYYYLCRYCNQFMRNRMKMKEHLRICERNPKKMEKELVSSNRTFNDNVMNLPYNCPRCHRSFRKKINFRRHTVQCGLKVPTTNSNKIEDIVHCVEDSDTHSTPVTNNAKADDGEHENADESIAIIESPPPSAKCHRPSSGKYVCEVCSKPFHAYANLKQHKTTHENEKKFVCVLCPKKFKRISGLNQHIRGFHYKIKPFSCPICSYTYALKGDMLRCRHSSLKKEASTVNMH